MQLHSLVCRGGRSTSVCSRSSDNLYTGAEMKYHNLYRGTFLMFASAVTCLTSVQDAHAQTKAAPPPAAAPKSSAAPAGKQAAGTPPANLGQLMKGVIYPASNVVFAAQSTNPA